MLFGRTRLRVATFAIGSLLAASGCGDSGGQAPVEPRYALDDSIAGGVSVSPLAGGGSISLPSTATLRITLLERNAAAWHALRVVFPQDTLLAGPGPLFPGPSFDVGPYPAGPVEIQLDRYNNYPPNEFQLVATAQVSGSYPNWTIAFEDGSDGDFDDIIISVQAFALDLLLECTPSSVVRATTPVSCVPSAPVGSNVVVTDWSFVGGPNDEFVVGPSGAPPATWEGLMVVSGTVTVFATVDGVPEEASATVTVTARPWPNPPLSTPVEEVEPPDPRYILPATPMVYGDLGRFTHAPAISTDYVNQALIAAVQSGPNFLLFYNTAPPVLGFEAYIQINRDALSNPQNDWYSQHPNRSSPPGGPVQAFCTRSQLRNEVLDLVVEHEAEHADFASDWWSTHSLNGLAESVVSDQGIVAVYNSTFDLWEAAQLEESTANKAAVDQNVTFPCAPMVLGGEI